MRARLAWMGEPPKRVHDRMLAIPSTSSGQACRGEQPHAYMHPSMSDRLLGGLTGRAAGCSGAAVPAVGVGDDGAPNRQTLGSKSLI